VVPYVVTFMPVFYTGKHAGGLSVTDIHIL